MAILTLYALFGDDIRLIGVSKKHDGLFYTVSSITLCFFLIEIVLLSLAKPNYFLGFYFWLDLISSLSLVFDIGWIWDLATSTKDFTSSNA